MRIQELIDRLLLCNPQVVEGKIREILREQSNLEEWLVKDLLLFRCDDVERAEIVAEIDETFGIKILDEDLKGIGTVGDVVNHVMQKLQKRIKG